MASPLYDLTRGNAPWRWGYVQEKIFHRIRAALTSDSVCLVFPHWNKTFLMECDASREGVGAVLSQEFVEGKLRPISFFSSRFNKAQKNYSASEFEAWAIVAAARKWRKYLQAASSVEIRTDHNPLQWLRLQRGPRGKFARWLIELESINYNIQYLRGKDNVLADHLSDFLGRMDVNDESECFERFVYSVDIVFPSEEMGVRQSEDPVVICAKDQMLTRNMVTEGPLRNQVI